jgi:hypothetical protein
LFGWGDCIRFKRDLHAGPWNFRLHLITPLACYRLLRHR